MAKGSLNLFVSKDKFLEKISVVEQKMAALDDVINRYNEAKKNLGQFMGETDDNYQAMVDRIDANVNAAKKSYTALQETKASLQDTVDKMDNMGKEVKETIDAATDAAKSGIEAAIKIDSVL